MNIDIYDKEIDTLRLKEELGWWDHGESPSFSDLIKVCMILCEKIAYLEQTINKLANDASCRANGMIPD